MTSFRLKLIAIIAMTIDHVSKVLGQSFILHFSPDAVKASYWITNSMEWIGRLAFPVFAFCIAEGCRKTRSIPKYIGRLLLFAVISEVFYSMAFAAQGLFGMEIIKKAWSSLISLRYGNVFVTLALGALAIYIYRILNQRKSKWLVWLSIPAILALMAAAGFLHSDYEGFGVLLIIALYVFSSKKGQLITILTWSTVFYMGWASWSGSALMWMQSTHNVLVYGFPWLFSCLTAILLYLYNGKRGTPLKWTFYIYYPAHLLVLAIIRMVATS